VAYPPHKLDKKYVYECEHSTHILSNLHGSEQLQKIKGDVYVKHCNNGESCKLNIAKGDLYLF
jgi:hypothetical protein